MYLFITYARKEMRGVQVRGLRIAKHFSKKEVMFANGGNDDWLKKEGYRYKNYDFNKFYLPSQIDMPRNVKCIIFCDLPTNRAFQLSLLMFAQERKIPCVVLDNIYRRNQTEDTVYKNTKHYSDKLILNGLSFMGKNNDKGIVVVPPLIDDTLIAGKSKEEIRNEIVKKFKISKKPNKIVFCVGYHSFARREILKIFNYFQKEDLEVLFIVVSRTKTIRKKPNIIEIPAISGDEMSFFTKAADLVICKAGYLQIIETLSMSVPLVGLGEASLEAKKGKIIIGKGTAGFKKKWLDKKILDTIIISEHVSDNLQRKIKKWLFSPSIRQKVIKKIKTLHNNKYNGSQVAASLIKTTKFRAKKFPKIVVISLDKKKETEEVKQILRKYPFALPIYLSLPFFTNVFNRKLADYDPTPKEEALHYNPALIYNFGFDSLHGFSKIFPWYDFLLKNIENFVKNSDKCIIVGKETYNYLEKILEKHKKKIKIIDKDFKYNVRKK